MKRAGSSQLSQVTFDASCAISYCSLSAGATVCVPDAATKTNMPQLIRWIAEKGITLIHCVPSLFRLISRELLAEPGLKQSFRTVKHILMAGEPCMEKMYSFGGNMALPRWSWSISMVLPKRHWLKHFTVSWMSLQILRWCCM